MKLALDVKETLPDDATTATLLGRAWVPGDPGGPSPVLVSDGAVYDVGRIAPTCADLVALPDLRTRLREDGGATPLGSLETILDNSAPGKRSPERPFLLAPIDLQAVKACGVTFARSLLERLIEEEAGGDPAAADAVRRELVEGIGADLGTVRPGSEEAENLKAALSARGMWSQYLEVGIGPDAEVFTKCQPMAAVGTGAEVGVHPDSQWSNPEPEVVLVVDAAGRAVGATLGNDVNLRDIEGRSALLLCRAKDNTGSAAVGPFIRPFDDGFTLDDVRRMDVSLEVRGDDGFVLDGQSSMSEISRDPAELVAQTAGANNQYPDGFVLFTGTMFAPTQDRDAKGQGFTHHLGDLVTIRSPRLGALVNRVNRSDRVPRFDFGAGALMRNLARRNLL